jgi:hypothetical protein
MARLFDDALEQYLEIDQAPVTAAPFTLSCFFNTDKDYLTQYLIYLAQKAKTNEAWGLSAAGGTTGDPVSFLAYDGGGTVVSTTSGYSVGTRHHAAGVCVSDTERHVYIDGGSKGSTTDDKSPDLVDRLSIGRAGDSSPGYHMSGPIAEVAIWNIDLIDAEIVLLAKGYSPLFIRPQNLVFYMPLVRDDDEDLIGGLSLTAFNAPTIDAHPPIIYPSPPFLSFPVSVAGQTINVNQVSETDLAQSLSWSPKNRFVDLITETDLAQAVSSLKTAQVALVTESDLAQAISADKAREVGQILETDLAQSLASLKLKVIAQTVETDLAQIVGKGKAKVIAQTIEADLAQSITWNPQTRLVGQVTETDFAQIITVLGEQIIPVNQVLETDIAQSILWSPKNRLVGQIAETDLAQAVSVLKTLSIGLVTETDQAQAIARLKTLLIGQVLETDFAQIISTTGEIVVGVSQVLETNLAQSILWSPKNRLVGQIVEADLAQALSSLKTAQVGIVSETDLAQVIGIIKSRVLGQVSETDLAQAITSSKLKVITQAAETDIAQIITVLFGVAEFFRTFNLYGEHIPETAYNLQGEHIVDGTLEGEHIPETEVDIDGEV